MNQASCTTYVDAAH